MTATYATNLIDAARDVGAALDSIEATEKSLGSSLNEESND